ncbi:MAG: hypothetical protein Aurels2KO_58030 [Aureliella sp.]
MDRAPSLSGAYVHTMRATMQATNGDAGRWGDANGDPTTMHVSWRDPANLTETSLTKNSVALCFEADLCVVSDSQSFQWTMRELRRCVQ